MPSDFLRVMGKVFLFTSVGLSASILMGGAGVAGMLGVLAAAGTSVAFLTGALAVEQRCLQARLLEECGEPGALPDLVAVGRASAIAPEPQLTPEAAALAAEDAAVDRYVAEMEVEPGNPLPSWAKLPSTFARPTPTVEVADIRQAAKNADRYAEVAG